MTVEEFREQLPTRAEFARNAPEMVDAIRALAAPDGVETKPRQKNALRLQAR